MLGKSSFAIWPTVVTDTNCPNKDCPHRRNEPRNGTLSQKADLHVNIWRLPSENNGSEPNRYLDFGFMLETPNQVEKINIYIPHGSEEKVAYTLKDLSTNLKNVDVLSAVFNDDLVLHNSVAAYQHLVVSEDEEKPCFTLHELTDKDYSFVERYDGTLLKISVPQNVKGRAYVRIRLEETALNHCVSSEPLANAYFQSFLSKVETTDFQLNEFRTLDKRLRERIRAEGGFEFDKINFFYICNSANDILVHSPEYSSCRYLESDLWKEYIEHKHLASPQKNGVLAYHWKLKAKKVDSAAEEVFKGVRSFSILVKNKYESLDWLKMIKTFLVVAVITVSMNVFSSCVYKLGSNIIYNWTQSDKVDNLPSHKVPVAPLLGVNASESN